MALEAATLRSKFEKLHRSTDVCTPLIRRLTCVCVEVWRARFAMIPDLFAADPPPRRSPICCSSAGHDG